MPARSRPWLAALRLGLLLAVTLGMFTLLKLRSLTGGGSAGRRLALAAAWGHRWARWARPALGFQLEIRGPLPPPGALLIPNHMGYMDIFALNAAVPLFFVPKADIAGWPLVGALVRGAGHVFIERANKRALLAVAGQIAARLRERQRVVVFLEGTSSGGGGVLPFKPSLLQPALDLGAPVVPAGIDWSVDGARNNAPVSVEEDIAYWRPEHVIGPHAWRLLGLRGLRARITFGAPLAINPQQPPERHELAARLRGQVIALRGEHPQA